MANVIYGKCNLWQTYYGNCNYDKCIYGKSIMANVTEPWIFRQYNISLRKFKVWKDLENFVFLPSLQSCMSTENIITKSWKQLYSVKTSYFKTSWNVDATMLETLINWVNKLSFKWSSIYKGSFPTYNGTMKNFVWSRMNKISMFSLWNRSFCCVFLLTNLILDLCIFKEYRCKSDMALFKIKILLKYKDSPFKFYLADQCRCKHFRHNSFRC